MLKIYDSNTTFDHFPEELLPKIRFCSDCVIACCYHFRKRVDEHMLLRYQKFSWVYICIYFVTIQCIQEFVYSPHTHNPVQKLQISLALLCVFFALCTNCDEDLVKGKLNILCEVSVHGTTVKQKTLFKRKTSTPTSRKFILYSSFAAIQYYFTIVIVFPLFHLQWLLGDGA